MDTWDLDIAVWNVDGKGSPEEVDTAIKKNTAKIPDIVCLQEANLPVDSNTTENFVWHCSGKLGSAVLIKKELADVEVVAFESVCEQIYVVELKNGNTSIKVISCCIPPSTNYVCEELWEKVTNVLKAIPSHMTYLLAGDFNAEIGSGDINKRVVSGGFGNFIYHDTSNENGVRLVNLVKNACLRVTNTFKPSSSAESDFKQYTYKDGDSKVQRSFIMMPKNRNGISRNIYCNVWVADNKHAILQNNLKVIVSISIVSVIIVIHKNQ